MAGLLEVPLEKLEVALTTMPTTMFVKKLNVARADASRNSLCMYIYQLAFDWCVEKINRDIARSENDAFRTVGVLDIFGFENFDARGQSNKFPQLCINLTNERLHQLFIKHVFEVEQSVYSAEDIEWEVQDYQSNLPIIQLITKSKGIFAFVNDAGKGVSDGSKADEAFLNNMNKAFAEVSTTGKLAPSLSQMHPYPGFATLSNPPKSRPHAHPRLPPMLFIGRAL